jgi:hypothetical protein
VNTLEEATDFVYDYIADDMWKEVINAGKQLFKTEFDLENHEPVKKPFRITVDGCTFTCCAYSASGDWQNPVRYYRCQFVKSENQSEYRVISFNTVLDTHDNSFFVFIPTFQDGNVNLVQKGKNWIASNNDEKKEEKINEKTCREALKNYLIDITHKISPQSLIEDIHENLKNLFNTFDRFCKEHGIFYDIVDDQHNRQGYLVKTSDSQKITEFIKPEVERLDLHLEVNDDRRDGVLYAFSLNAISDDGHWVVLTDKDKRERGPKFSPLPYSDAERVDREQTMYQKKKKKDKIEEIWKWPTRILGRIQSRVYSTSSKLFDPTTTCDPKTTVHQPHQSKDIDKAIEEAMIPISPIAGMPSENDFAYHATNLENAYEIANNGIETHSPDYGTEQNTWPDGSTEERSYFVNNAGIAWQFAPEHGKAVLLRIPMNAVIFKHESTGDVYATKTIPADKIEIHTKHGWVNITQSDVFEDQYKHPTGKHRRSQSARRSSFEKSPSFGGIKESYEPDTNIALNSANRSSDFSPGEPKRPPLPYNQRKNATDLAHLPPPSPPPAYESDKFDAKLDDALKTIVIPDDEAARERKDPTRKLDKPTNLKVGMVSGVRPQTPTGTSKPASNVRVTPGVGGAFVPPSAIVYDNGNVLLPPKPNISFRDRSR